MSPIPKTCKAAVLEEYGQPLQIREVPIPEVGPGAILVKVELAGICGTDVHQQQGELSIKSPLPNIQGHETIGRIVELGAGRVRDAAGEEIKIGDRIMWAHADCGECYWCQIARDPVLCARRSGYGWAPPSALRGGFAEYEYVTPATNVVKVPDELTEEEAVGVGCAFRSVVAGYERFGKVGLMNDVVVQGCRTHRPLFHRGGPGERGPHHHRDRRSQEPAGARQALGSRPRHRHRRAQDRGRAQGVDPRPHPGKRPRGRGRGIGRAGGVHGRGGAHRKRRTVPGPGAELRQLGDLRAQPASPSKALTIVGSVSAAILHFYKALQFIKTHRSKYPFAELVSRTYQLEDINQALADMKSGTEIKPVIDNRNR